MKSTDHHGSSLVWAAVLLAGLALPCPGLAQQGTVLAKKLNAQGEGYSILRVWGTPYEMGYAQGHLYADEVIKGVSQVRLLLGAQYYLTLRLAVPLTIWKPAEIEKELDGMVAGVKAARPLAVLDKIDLKVVNTYGDWATLACRSHSCWGSFVQGKSKTLSTRRLDYPISASLTAIRHHLLLARQPTGGGVRWVSLGWPGFVISVTGVNEFGTLASLHDYNSTVDFIGLRMPRSVTVGYALTLVAGLHPSKHLDAVYKALGATPILTSTFINYYVPQGYGGVITCLKGQACSKKRTPVAGYHGGQVLITTNAETDGKSTPGGGDFINSYYQKGGTKNQADHWALLNQGKLTSSPEVHRLSVDFRAQGDITLWFSGALSVGSTPLVKQEFHKLFQPQIPPADGPGPGPSDSGGKDAPSDRGTDSPVSPRKDKGDTADGAMSGLDKSAAKGGGKGSCHIGGDAGVAGALYWLLLALTWLAIRSRTRPC